jgi:secreted trypsin-like serine protease
VGIAHPASDASGKTPWQDVVKAREAAVAKAAGIPIVRPRPTPRIIGGNVAPPGKWPFTVGLLLKDQTDNYFAQFCGGSLIAQRYVLTAAHCVEGLAAPFMQVLVGTQDLESGGRRIDVTEIRLHPSYDPFTFDYDVAVLELARPSGITARVQLPAPAQEAFLAAPGKLAAIMGWGDTDPSFASSYPTKMNETTIRIVARNICNGPTSYDGLITQRMICAGPLAGGRDSCQGDSGGPMVVRDAAGRWVVQAGIVSWGFQCAAPNYPGVYSRVSVLRSWIRASVAAMAGPPPQRLPSLVSRR